MPDPAQPPPTRSETEERIFEAALKVFASKGRDGARMQEIADEAGLNKAMLHYYFQNKERLYEEVFAYVFRQFMASFGEGLRAKTTFEATLRAFIDGYIDFIRDHQDAMRLMVGENLAGGSLVGRHLQRAARTSEAAPPRLLVERIAEAVARGEIRPVDPDQTVLTVISGCLFFFVAFPTVRLMHPAAHADPDAFIEARKAHLFDVIFNGLKV